MILMMIHSNFSIWIGTNSGHVDSADSLSRFGSNLDVTLVSPRWTPWVLNENVLFSIVSFFFTVSNSKNTMVNMCSTFFRAENTSGIMLEDSIVSFDSHWSRSNSNSCFQLRIIIRSDIHVVWYVNLSVPFIFVLASSSLISISWSVRIITFKDSILWLQILESKSHRASITSTVKSRAINKLLFRKTIEVSSRNLMSSFDGTSCWEWPTWPTHFSSLLQLQLLPQPNWLSQN